MTDDRMALAEMLEKGSDSNLLREMIGYVAQRLMQLDVEGRVGAGQGECREIRYRRRRSGYAAGASQQTLAARGQPRDAARFMADEFGPRIARRRAASMAHAAAPGVSTTRPNGTSAPSARARRASIRVRVRTSCPTRRGRRSAPNALAAGIRSR